MLTCSLLLSLLGCCTDSTVWNSTTYSHGCLIAAKLSVSKGGEFAGPGTWTDELQWFKGSYARALRHAKKKNAGLVLVFSPSWSDWSQKLESGPLQDPSVIRELQSYVLLKLGADSKKDKDLATRFKVRSFPSMVFVRIDDSADDLISGYIDAPNLVQQIQRIKRGQGTLSGLEKQLEINPKDLAVRLRLANKKWELGDDAGYFEQLEKIKELDPQGKSLTRRALMLNDYQEEIFGCRSNGGPVHLEPLLEFLAEEKYPSVLFEGWSYLGTVYDELGDSKKARESHMQAWKHVPVGQVPFYGQAVAQLFLSRKEELSEAERSFALKLAVQSAKRAHDVQDGKQQLGRCLFTLAMCHQLNGQLQSAIRANEQALQIFPDNPNLLKQQKELRTHLEQP